MINENKNNFPSIESLSEVIKKVENERQILLDTLNSQNKRIEELNLIKDEISSFAEQNQNMQDAMYAILYNLESLDKKMVFPARMNEILSKIGTIAINSLLDFPIRNDFENEVIEGSLIACNMTKDFFGEGNAVNH